MKTNNSFGCRFLSVFLCLSMLLAPVVALADAIPASQILKDSVMSADEAVTIVEGKTLTTPLYRLVEDSNEISGDKTYAFVSGKTVGSAATFLKYATALEWNGTSNGTVYNLPVDIVDGDTVYPAGTYVAAPSTSEAYTIYEWYIKNTTGIIYNPNDIILNMYSTTSNYSCNEILFDHASRVNCVRMGRGTNTGSYMSYVFNTCGDAKGITDANSVISLKYRYWNNTGSWSEKDGRLFLIDEDGKKFAAYTLSATANSDAWQTFYVDLAELKAQGYLPTDIVRIELCPFGDAGSKVTANDAQNFDLGYVGFFTSKDEATSYSASQPLSASLVNSNADIAASRSGDKSYTTTTYSKFVRFVPSAATNEFYKFIPYSASNPNYLMIRYRTNMTQTDVPRAIGFNSYNGSHTTQVTTDNYVADGNWHTAVFNVSAINGSETALRIDFARNNLGGSTYGSYYFDIATIAYFNAEADARAFGDSFIVPEITYSGSELRPTGSDSTNRVNIVNNGNYTTYTMKVADPYIWLNLPTNTLKSNLNYIVVKYRLYDDSATSHKFHFFNSGTYTEVYGSGEYIPDGGWHYAIVQKTGTLTTDVTRLRFDIFNEGEGSSTNIGCSVDVASIAIFNTKADAQAYANDASLIADDDAQKYTYTINSAKDTTKYLYGKYNVQASGSTRVSVLVGSTKTAGFLPVDEGYLRVADVSTKNTDYATLPSSGAVLYIYEKVADKNKTIPAVKAWLVDDYGCVATGVDTSAPTGAYLKVMAGDEVYDVPVTVDMLYKADGTQMSTATEGTYYNLIVKYKDKEIYSKFILVVRNGTALISGSFYKLVTPLDPDGEMSHSIKNGTNYMLIDRAESGYGKALAIQYTITDVTTVKANPRHIYEVEIDGKKEYFAYPEGNQREVWKTNFVNYAHPLGQSNAGPYFTFETQGITTSGEAITGYLYYNNMGSSIHTVKWDTSAVPKDSTLKVARNIDTSSVYNHAGYLWCEMPETSISFTHRSGKTLTANIGKGTGLACYAPARVYGQGDTSIGTLQGGINEFTKNLNEWRGMHFANEINNITTRVPVDAYVTEDKGVEIEEGISNMTVYDRIYYYEEDTSIKSITAHIDTFDVAIQHGAAGADLTGANIVITTTKNDGSVSVSRVPITMDMLSTDSAGKNAVSTTDSADANKTTSAHVFYQDTRIGSINLTVAAETGDPVYPNPGSVVITKELDTSTHDYWKTGTARLELSVTGVPTSSGADVVIAIDNSGSMEVDIGGKTRREAITDAIEAALTTFANSKEDIAVSVVTFDGYDLIDGGYVLNRTRDAVNKVDTNCDSNLEPDTAQFLTAGFNQYIPDVDDRFVESKDLASKIDKIVANYKYTGAGTNYDRGLELAYETLNARQKQNALNGTKRDSYLILMGDGETLQMNYMGLCSYAPADLHDYMHSGKLDETSSFTYKEGNTTYTKTLQEVLPKDIYDADGDGDITELHPYYDTHYNKYGEMWMAEAIKGSVDKKYMVIDPDANPTDKYLDYVNGLGAKIYTIGVGMLSEGELRRYTVEDDNGGTCYIDQRINAGTAKAEVLRKISSDWSHEYFAKTFPDDDESGVIRDWRSNIYQDNKYAKFVNDDVTAIKNVFTSIAGSISVLSNAVFTDTMSDDVDLQMKKQITTDVSLGKDPIITVKSYDTYKYKEIGTVVGGVYVSAELVGKIKPGSKVTTLETVTITNNGSTVKSDQKGETNILSGGVIKAEYFYYNTTANSVTTNDPSGKSITIPAESFKWFVGEVPENKYVLSFDVYLTGTMEGTRDKGTYPTNKDTDKKTGAYLTYTNFEGNYREIEVPTPYLPWGDAQVSVAYYLVDSNGRPITHLGGSPVSFDLAYKVTSPEIYTSFALNNETGTITAQNLPKGLSLYDPNASYEVKATSDNGGAWKITKGEGKIQSTYVTQYSSGENTATNEQYVYTGDSAAADTDFVTGDLFAAREGYTYVNTVVWFAVTSPISASPETVVIDYGLPVDIDVTENDIGGFKATAITSQKLPVVTQYEGADITAYQATKDEYTSDYKKYFDDSDGLSAATGKYGKAELTSIDIVRYTPNTMVMDGTDVFTYALEFINGTPSYAIGMDYLFRKVTVVPATNIYYEEEFIDFTTYKSNLVNGKKTKTTDAWKNVSDIEGTTGSVNLDNNPQAQDRPGVDETIFDVGNIYGYDAQYDKCATFSLGNSKKITVDANITGEAQFTFKGTGFDIIGLTNHNTGTVIVQVYKCAKEELAYDGRGVITNKAVKTLLVDTYYGYTYEKQSDDSYKWVINADASETLYQVPVICVENLAYGTYTAVVTVSYSQYLDNGYKEGDANNSYDFYFDAVRIYNPANPDGTDYGVIEDAYTKDKEGWPVYTELRDVIIDADEIISSVNKEGQTLNGSMFIDGCPTINRDTTGYDQWVNVDYFHGRYQYERNQFDDDDTNDPSGAIKNYANYGPNNEVYLAPGQAIAFTLGTDDYLEGYVAAVHVAMKSAKGSPVVNMYAVTPNASAEKGYDFTEGLMEKIIASSTELYYDISALDGKTVVIMNSAEADSDNILSITTVKRTFIQDPSTVTKPDGTSVVRTNSVYINRQTVDVALASLEMESDSIAAFEPETFDVSVSKSSVEEGKTVTVTVKTSSDVDYITVNGEEVTKYRRSLFTKQRTWTYTVKATEAGELPIEVIAYSTDGECSAPVVKTVEVISDSSTSGSSTSGWFDKWFGGLFGKK